MSSTSVSEWKQGPPAPLTGLNSAMSPLHSLTLASVNVLTRPYPTGIPANTQDISTTNSRICARGRKARYESPGLRISYNNVQTDPTDCQQSHTVYSLAAVTLPWLKSTPFGVPVDPLVYMQQ